jgi:hypothetical protein
MYVAGGIDVIDYIYRDRDDITWRYYNVVVQPGQTIAFLTFAVQESNRANSWDEARGIVNSVASGNLSSAALLGLSMTEYASLTNAPTIPPDELFINPYGGFISSGTIGGPFTPRCKTYTLTNTGPNTLNWTATTTQPWLDLTLGSGTLEPNDSNTAEICINYIASSLTHGVYTDTVTFSNLDSGVDQTREVELTVTPEQAKLTAQDGYGDDLFGYSVSIDGSYCIVGARNDDDRGINSGSGYIFKRRGTGWTQQAKINASDGQNDDHFGSSIDISRPS